MAAPRYSEQQLWQEICDLWARGDVWCSLEWGNTYTPVDLDQAKRRCRFEYESGNVKRIPLNRLYALYAELYSTGELSAAHLRYDRDYCQRVTGRRYWHAPGAAMLALLPVLDDRVGYANGELFITSESARPHW